MRARYQELQAQLLSREAALREQAFQRQQYAFMRARLDTNLEALARYLAATEEALKCVARAGMNEGRGDAREARQGARAPPPHHPQGCAGAGGGRLWAGA